MASSSPDAGARSARVATQDSATSPRTGNARARSSTSRWPRTSRCTIIDEGLRARFGWLEPGGSSPARAELLHEFDVRGGGPRTAAPPLCPGATSRRSSSRARSRAIRVSLIAAQPTRGLDVGAIEFVHRRLVQERDEGRAVLLVSLELEEILSLSDRILVLYEGRIVARVRPDRLEGGARHRHDRGRHVEERAAS